MKKYKFLFLLLFGLFIFIPKDCFALETTNLVPEKVVYYSGTSTSTTDSVNTFTYFNTYFYGYTYAASDQKAAVAFRFPSYSSLNNKVGSMSFSIYVGGSIANYFDNAFTVYIKDYYNNISTCYVQNSQISGSNSAVLNYIQPVICDNVSILGNFDVYIGGNFYNVGGTIAVTNLTFREDVSSDINSSIQDNTTAVEEQTEATKEQTDTIKDSDTSGAEEDAISFFGDFESDDFGLSSIITMPLQFIQGLSSSTCYSLNLPLPFVDTNVTLPCMTSIYQKYFGDFLTLYQIITTGFIAYGVCVNIFRLVQGFKNPDNDNVEVMEL